MYLRQDLRLGTALPPFRVLAPSLASKSFHLSRSSTRFHWHSRLSRRRPRHGAARARARHSGRHLLPPEGVKAAVPRAHVTAAASAVSARSGRSLPRPRRSSFAPHFAATSSDPASSWQARRSESPRCDQMHTLVPVGVHRGPNVESVPNPVAPQAAKRQARGAREKPCCIAVHLCNARTRAATSDSRPPTAKDPRLQPGRSCSEGVQLWPLSSRRPAWLHSASQIHQADQHRPCCCA